jgi:hypothetical protein
MGIERVFKRESGELGGVKSGGYPDKIFLNVLFFEEFRLLFVVLPFQTRIQIDLFIGILRV